MAALSQEEKEILGDAIEPFARNTRGKTIENDILEGEGSNEEFLDLIHDGIENKKPSYNYVELTAEEVEIVRSTGKFEEKCFLWVLDEVSIKILREKTPNVLRTHKKEFICHTNITGCAKAHLGGEMFFSHGGEVYISWFSDRYGNPSDEQWEQAKEYIENLGYGPLMDILEILEKGDF